MTVSACQLLLPCSYSFTSRVLESFVARSFLSLCWFDVFFVLCWSVL